jgi:hypothetical protein
VTIWVDVHPIEHWLAHYREICQEYDYYPDQIEEYGELLRRMAQMIEEEE